MELFAYTQSSKHVEGVSYVNTWSETCVYFIDRSIEQTICPNDSTSQLYKYKCEDDLQKALKPNHVLCMSSTNRKSWAFRTSLHKGMWLASIVPVLACWKIRSRDTLQFCGWRQVLSLQYLLWQGHYHVTFSSNWYTRYTSWGARATNLDLNLQIMSRSRDKLSTEHIYKDIVQQECR